MAKRRWTQDEIDAVRNGFRPKRGYAVDLARQLNRTLYSVRHLAKRLGLLCKRDPLWSEAEDRFLTENYSFTPTHELVSKTGRTKAAISERAGKFGLTKSASGRYAQQITTLKLGCPQAKALSETDKAYIAGLFDGEGCVTASMRSNNRRGVQIQLIIVNTHLGVIQWLCTMLGGNVWTKHPTGRMRRPLHRWVARGGKACQDVLEAIMPYLIVKRSQAIEAMKWQPGMPYERCLELHDSLKRLKKPQPFFGGNHLGKVQCDEDVDSTSNRRKLNCAITRQRVNENRSMLLETPKAGRTAAAVTIAPDETMGNQQAEEIRFNDCTSDSPTAGMVVQSDLY